MSGDASVEQVFETVLETVEPDSEERERLAAVATELCERAEAAIAELPVDAEVVQVGSTARDTWLAGDHDVDLFVRFPETIDRSELRSYGLAVGHAVLGDGREEYAEHPYVAGVYEGVDVDVVPCYDVADATAIRSAVDRTPFHNAYVADRLTPELATEVRLAKAFCRAIGVYGSNLRTRGFSGYLLELLVLEYGGLGAFLSAARGWTPPIRIDPADHGTVEFDDPLVFVDPTDPERNVAAVLSATNLARFQHHARRFLDDPDVDRFEPTSAEPLDTTELHEHLDRRGTTLLGILVEVPAQVDDQLYPQVRTSESSVVAELDRRGFDVVRSAVAITEAAPTPPGDGSVTSQSESGTRRALLLFELAVATRPAIERHEGPPVHVEAHATGFYETYAEAPDVYGPFVDGGRYVVERPREFTDARSLLESEAIHDVKHGAAVAEALETEYTVYQDAGLDAVVSDFGDVFRRYFEPSV
jgi:tRNA nucleotidyltransferase (CCA-adding enzyme)